MNLSASPFIARRQDDPAGLDFEALRQAGLERLQELCGTIWSDYNLHDPGVTMLEQLCYGLTDLVYRSSFEPDDYLFGADGRIDAARHALLPPEETLSSAPLTLLDYQKLLADALPEVRNVWVVPAKSALPGVLDIHLQLADTLETSAGRVQELLARATNLYHSHRNLCEDLGEISVVGHMDYHLSGTIEVNNSRRPAEILADIYFACATAISPPIPQQSYQALAKDALDQLFDGPLTQHGHIDVANLPHWNETSLSKLVQAISQVEGVSRIGELILRDADGNSCPAAVGDPLAKRVPRLVIPRSQSEQLIKLRLAGQAREVSLPDFLNRLERLNFAAETRRHGQVEHEPISPLPTGAPANFGPYTSVQQHFPPVYGIGSYGLPASAAPSRKAQARQLQAYLLLFEQLMINFQQGLQALPQLFSLDDTLDRTYFHHLLGDQDLPGVEQLYRGGKPGANTGLGKILARLDDFGERRSRALDFLLALHGEKFNQHALRNFIPGSGRQHEARLIQTKIAFLRQAPRLNARRMGAFNYREAPGPDNIAALAEKIGLLLDLPTQAGQPLSKAFGARGFRHLSDPDFFQETRLKRIPSLDGAEAAFPLAEAVAPGSKSILDLRVLCPTLLNRGNDLHQYHILADEHDPQAPISLYLDGGDAAGCFRLSGHTDKRTAVAEANRLSRVLDTLATESLGFHLLEHLLLRPVQQTTPPGDSAFHPFRISAIFPAWSSRLCNPEFRKLLEETISLCSPAHISVQVIWLEFQQMAVFEHLHQEWLGQKRNPAADPQGLDRMARQLTLFLERQAQSADQRMCWL